MSDAPRDSEQGIDDDWLSREDLATILVSSVCSWHDREAAAAMLRGDAEAVKACEVMNEYPHTSIRQIASAEGPITYQAACYSGGWTLTGDLASGEGYWDHSSIEVGPSSEAAIIAAHRSLVAETGDSDD